LDVYLQIVAGLFVLSLDPSGLWLHLAVALDGNAKRVVQYLNGQTVGENPLKINPPFRVGAAQLGELERQRFFRQRSFLIRNFSGAMDEFCLFRRALNADEIHAQYSTGRPHPERLPQSRK
jgi:hypothetical protein